MRFRKLRIAWSVVWGVVAVLLCVRSFRNDTLWPTPNFEAGNFAVYSTHGSLIAASGWFFDYEAPTWPGYYIPSRFQSLGPSSFNHVRHHTSRSGFHVEYFGWRYWSFQIPYWFVLALFGSITAVPWMRGRFSLRTLLIAMTLVALVLGAIVYAVR
jgi:hypothetical protein